MTDFTPGKIYWLPVTAIAYPPVSFGTTVTPIHELAEVVVVGGQGVRLGVNPSSLIDPSAYTVNEEAAEALMDTIDQTEGTQ